MTDLVVKENCTYETEWKNKKKNQGMLLYKNEMVLCKNQNIMLIMMTGVSEVFAFIHFQVPLK